MEVLISIGILAVGLSAVVALIPAGGSEAQRALAEDRNANVGLGALEEAVTRGILSPNRWSPAQAAPYTVLIDPIGGAAFAGLNLVTLDNLGVTALTADEVFRSQDDPVYTLENSGEDGPAEPLYFSGNAKRLSEGNYSWLATLVPASNGQDHVLAVVTFSKRAESPTNYTLTNVSGSTVKFSWTGTLGALQDTFPRGSAVLLSDETNDWNWRRIIFVTLANGTAEIMVASDLSPGLSAGDKLFAFQGAIGVAERIVRLEGVSPWSQ